MSVTTEIDGRKIRGNSWGADWKGDVVVNRMYVMEDGENKIADLAFAALVRITYFDVISEQWSLI